MLNSILNSIRNVFNSEYFFASLATALVTFIFGVAFGYAGAEDLKKQQCDEMSVSEVLEYPYCRNYLESELERLGD